MLDARERQREDSSAIHAPLVQEPVGFSLAPSQKDQTFLHLSNGRLGSYTWILVYKEIETEVLLLTDALTVSLFTFDNSTLV